MTEKTKEFHMVELYNMIEELKKKFKLLQNENKILKENLIEVLTDDAAEEVYP